MHCAPIPSPCASHTSVSGDLDAAAEVALDHAR
jgi:hypothetical protein